MSAPEATREKGRGCGEVDTLRQAIFDLANDPVGVWARLADFYGDSR